MIFTQETSRSRNRRTPNSYSIFMQMTRSSFASTHVHTCIIMCIPSIYLCALRKATIKSWSIHITWPVIRVAENKEKDDCIINRKTCAKRVVLFVKLATGSRNTKIHTATGEHTHAARMSQCEFKTLFYYSIDLHVLLALSKCLLWSLFTFVEN